MDLPAFPQPGGGCRRQDQTDRHLREPGPQGGQRPGQPLRRTGWCAHRMRFKQPRQRAPVSCSDAGDVSRPIQVWLGQGLPGSCRNAWNRSAYPPATGMPLALLCLRPAPEFPLWWTLCEGKEVPCSHMHCAENLPLFAGISSSP